MSESSSRTTSVRRTPDEEYRSMKRTARVRPEIGSGGDGHTFPGATYPFGLVQPSPDTGREGYRYCSGYRYEDDRILGFSQTHLSGTGCGDLGRGVARRLVRLPQGDAALRAGLLRRHARRLRRPRGGDRRAALRRLPFRVRGCGRGVAARGLPVGNRREGT